MLAIPRRRSAPLSPSHPSGEKLCDVAEAARRAGALVTQALGVPLSTHDAEEAPLVCVAPEVLAAQLRSLMVELVIGQRARWRGAADGGAVLAVRAVPAERSPASLRVFLAFGGATRELTLPVAGASLLVADALNAPRASLSA